MRTYSLISAAAFMLLLGVQTAHAAGATVHFEQKSSNATYGEWVLTYPNGAEYISALRTKILQNLEAGTYRLSVRSPAKSHSTISITKNGVLVQESNSNSITFDVVDGDALRITTTFVYTGTVQVKTNPSNVGFVMEDTLGQKFTGVTPAEFTDMPPIGYRVTYDLTANCEAQKIQQRPLIEGSTLTFFADLDCGDARIPTAGRTAQRIATEKDPVKPIAPAVHADAPAERLLQTSSISEVVAGGVIRFTVSVRNVTRQTLDNVVVTDQFSPDMIDIITPLKDGGVFATDNMIEWNIPKIYAGKTWTTTFEARAADHLKPGDRIVLLARGMSDENMTHPAAWSSVVGVGVAYMPQTGFRYDVLFALLAMVGAAVITRKTLAFKS